MLEGWTTLGFMAALTKRARLGLMVGGVHYRNPALWVKAATTLDVLSGGRAWLGIGAAWNEDESRGLGFPFPPLGVRFEMLEETLQIAHRDVAGRARQRGRASRPAVPGRASAQLPAVTVTPQGPDHDRWWRREEDTPSGRPVRRRDQRLRLARGHRPQVPDPAPSTARRSAATPTRSSDRPSRTSRSRPTAPGAPRRRAGSSSASASSPTPAPSTSSSACASCPIWPPSNSSGARSSRSSGTFREPRTVPRQTGQPAPTVYPPGVSAPCYDDDHMSDETNGTHPTRIEPLRGLQHDPDRRRGGRRGDRDRRADIGRRGRRHCRCQGRHHRVRPGRADRRDLCLAREPRAGGPGRFGTGRATDADQRRRELPGLRGRHPGPRPDGRHARPGRAVRIEDLRRRHRSRGLLPAPVPHLGARHRVPGPGRDHRHRRVGALARSRERDPTARPRRVGLRDVRRVLLQGPRDRGHRWRRHGARGGDLPDAVRDQGAPAPPPRHVPRVQDHGRSRQRAREDPDPHQHGGGRGHRRQQGRWPAA